MLKDENMVIALIERVYKLQLHNEQKTYLHEINGNLNKT